MSATIAGRRSSASRRPSSSIAAPPQPSTGQSPAGMTSPGCTRSYRLRNSFVSSTGPRQPQSWHVAVSVLGMRLLLELQGESAVRADSPPAGGMRSVQQVGEAQRLERLAQSVVG